MAVTPTDTILREIALQRRELRRAWIRLEVEIDRLGTPASPSPSSANGRLLALARADFDVIHRADLGLERIELLVADTLLAADREDGP